MQNATIKTQINIKIQIIYYFVWKYYLKWKLLENNLFDPKHKIIYIICKIKMWIKVIDPLLQIVTFHHCPK